MRNIKIFIHLFSNFIFSKTSFSVMDADDICTDEDNQRTFLSILFSVIFSSIFNIIAIGFSIYIVYTVFLLRRLAKSTVSM